MADYTPTGNPVAETRGISSQVRNEFALIQTAIATKSDKTGGTYSGTHNYSGATITVTTLPLTNNSTQVASTAFVQGLLGTMPVGTLPAIAGKGLNTLRVNVTETGVEWGSNSGSDLYLAATFGAL